MTKVSVSSLCEFAARTGGLEFRYTPAPSAEEGISGHRTVQERRPDPYIAEHPLSGECEGLIVGGRVDGYYASVQDSYLEEIKTHRGNVNRIGPGKRAMHWAQLKVYGALFCRLQQRASVRLRLTYFEVKKEEESYEEEECEAGDLWAYLSALCRDYAQWLEREYVHRQARDNALRGLELPFTEFRGGQRLMSESVYKAIATETSLLLQAPTGIGKTVGVLFPALHAMPVQQLDRLFYLSVRNTGKSLALDGLRQIVNHQSELLPIRVLELSSLEQSCDHPEAACHGDSCPLANGFFDKLGAARDEAVKLQVLDVSALTSIARKHDLCRYFLAQEMAHWSDVVVADVNHYFDQHALLHALTVQNEWRVVPLVDEAHNLIDRARSMYSIQLSEAALLYTVRKPPAALQKPLALLESAWNDLVKPSLKREEFVADERSLVIKDIQEDVPEALNDALYALIAAITDYLSDNHRAKDIQEVLFTAIGFLRLAESFGEHSLCTLSFESSPGWRAKITGSAVLAIDNLIPADHLAERFKAAHSVVLFSATLSPANYYRDLLGMPLDTVFEDIPSPFVREQIDLRLITNISTRMDRRTDSLPLLAQRIAAQHERQPGNYLVFLSSLSYAHALYDYMAKHHPELNLQCQRPAMTTLQRQEFIRQLSDDKPAIGICVLGGVFGEGVDLPGEKLIGVFVATLGLPPNDDNREQLKEVLETRYGEGYNYAYLYPAITKVIQAAGRLIRTPTDRGIIELIDDRYRHAHIRKLLPAWWGVDSASCNKTPLYLIESVAPKAEERS